MPAAAIPLFERLLIETQSNCNRSCWFCPRTYDRSGAYLDADGRPVLRQMATATVLDLLDQARALGFTGRVGFHHYSEPLLDRRNLDFARAARARGLQPYLHTNGDVLKRDPALCRAVADVYALVVVGLYDYETDAELAEAREFWRDRLAGAALRFSAIGRQGALTADSMGIPKALVPTDRRVSIPDLTYRNAPCHRPLIRMIVRHDGAVCQCCEDTRADFDLGSVHDRPLGELWFSPRHVAIVQALMEGRREEHALCRGCPLPPTGPRPDGVPIELAPRNRSAAAV